MKSSLLCLLLGLGLTGCKDDADSATGLAGTWKLIDRNCECSPELPNETAKFTATDFAFYNDGQLSASGTYNVTTGPTGCSGSGASAPVLQFTYTYAKYGWTPENAFIKLNGSMLVLNYNEPCMADAPIKTYQHLGPEQ